MSIIAKIKRAFGFDPVVVVEDEETPCPTGYQRHERRQRHHHGDGPDRADSTINFPVGSQGRDAQQRRRIDELDNALKTAETASDEANKARLSAERQKRALADRNTELERRILTLEAECEQLRLENSSMVSRLRPDGDIPAPALRGRAADDARVQRLQADLDAANDTIARLTEAADSHAHEEKRYHADVETFNVKTKIADAMINDLQSRVSSLNHDLKQAQDEQKRAQSELSRAQEELRAAHDELDAAAHLADEVEKFEAYRSRAELRIAELQRSLALKSKEIKNLNATLEHERRRYTDTEQLLRKEIKSLKHRPDSHQATPAPAPAEASQVVAHDAPTKDERRRDDRRHGRKRHSADAPDSQMSLW